MDQPLDEQYLTWLYARIGSVRETRKTRTHWSLLKLLYTKEFVWLIPNDDNRVEDGRDLRYEFLDEMRLTHVDPNWMGMGCSVLEMIMGVAVAMAFEDDRTPHYWFWGLMNNLGLSGYNDKEFNADAVDDIVDNLIWRTYAADGTGGMFPLKHSSQDQRYVEIWYQLQAYLIEEH